jgi:hypothetical protein
MDQPTPPDGRSGSGVSLEYRPLFKYLDTRFADTVVLTFAQIEDLIGLDLPRGAYTEPGWWAVGTAGMASPQSAAWTQAHRSATVNLAARTVTFDRDPG